MFAASKMVSVKRGNNKGNRQSCDMMSVNIQQSGWREKISTENEIFK